MQKFNILLFFFIFEFICVVKSQEPKETYEGQINEDDAAKLLHKLEPGKALPLVLFRMDYFERLILPWILRKVKSLNGKMIEGTEFTSKWEHAEQMFFCPKNDEEKCLVRTTSFEALECTSEPIPVSESKNEECGNGNQKIGVSHEFVYQICEDQIGIDTKAIPFYRYCYDENQKQTLFTVHTIESPELLTAKLLLREREMIYPIIMNDGTKVTIKREADGKEVYDPPASKLSSLKPGYRWRTLVQFNDMALALWRKPLFHEMNLALQHENLIKIWDDIGEYVRSNAIPSSNNDHKTVVYTGVFDLKSESEIRNDDQSSKIWVKLIITKTPIITISYPSKAYRGVAILMNNFIDSDTSFSSTSKSNGIETYCDQDVCLKSLKDEFKKIQGNVRCCLVTKKFLDLFDHQQMDLKELYIPKINLGKDQEVLEDEQNDETGEQPVKSLCKIQSREILPVILFLYEDQDKIELGPPKQIQQIVTKNKRIVDGSQFSWGNIGKQVFFCPTEDPNETCLVPRKFDRFESLQCTKLPVPKVTKALAPSDKEIHCGADDKGILYDVIYEFCTNVPQSYKFEDSGIKIYQFCYDSIEQEILYTRHEPSSSYLLNSKLLFWERKAEFPMPTDSPLPLSNIKELQDAITKQSFSQENDDSISPIDTNQSVYKLQKLVPSEDMAFASWKIPTNLLVNVAFQHKSLISFWKEINRKVNDYIRKIGSTNVVIYNGGTRAMWFKIIQKKRVFRNDEAIAIFMQNYINRDENILKKYCDTNICLDEFQKKFNKIGSQVRCCRLTTKIVKKFNIQDVSKEKDTITLRIPDIIIDLEDDDSY